MKPTTSGSCTVIILAIFAALSIVACIAFPAAAQEQQREVIFSDDFSKPSDRWQSFAGAWAVADGVMKQTVPGYDLGIVVCDLYLCCDYRFETKVRLVEGGEGAGLYWNVPDAKTGENGNMARSEGEGPLMYGWMDGRFYNCVGWGTGTKLKDKQWHTIRLDVRNSDGSFDLYWDDAKVVDNGKVRSREGYVGLQTSMGSFEFDDVKISVVKGADWQRQPLGRVAPEWAIPTAVLPNGDAVYPIWNKNIVQIISQDGKLVREFGATGDGPDQLSLPTAAAVDKAGNIYIAEAGNNRVQVFDSQGHHLRFINGDFKAPSGVAVDDKDRLWVVGGGDCRLYCVGKNKKVDSYSFLKDSAIQASRLGRIAFIDGKLYVADSGNRRVMVCDTNELTLEPKWIQLDAVSEPCAVAKVGGLFVVTTWRGMSVYDADWKHLADYSGRASKANWPHQTKFDAAGKLIQPVIDPSLAKSIELYKHCVPVDKKLSDAWLKSLYEKGSPTEYWGSELDYINMPIGGIGAGQLYLHGDGTLGCWRLFNRTPPTEIGQGFAVIAETADGAVSRRLNRQDFPKAKFRGEYPVGTVQYRDENFPLEATLEAFTPFIPLDSDDSTLPATMFRVTVKNISDMPVKASVLGWLDNGVFAFSKSKMVGVKHTRVSRVDGGTMMLHTAGQWQAQADSKPREDILITDFNGDNYGQWKATGDAFGDKPAALPDGRKLVHTYIPGQDGPQGTLTSPEFNIERPFINLLIAGGGHVGQTCVNVVVNDKVVASICGENNGNLALRTLDVSRYQGQKAHIEILDRVSGGWGHIIVDDIKQSDTPAAVDLTTLVDNGSMTLVLAEEAECAEMLQATISSANENSKNLDDVQAAEDIDYPLDETHNAALAAPEAELAPGQQRTYVFALAWYFPMRAEGKAYADRFADAADVAKYVLQRREKLTADTMKWRDTYYDSTLPTWLLDRLHAPVSTLATDTCEMWKGPRFWAWEGVVCCEGTCTHVWNYEHAMAMLFPDLERTIRDKQDFGQAFYEDGLVGFRSNWQRYAADGQCGTILKAYREHRMSADDAFLKRNWPKIKKALEYSINQDGNDDGLIENAQHNTYDIDFYGANTFVGSLYLAALRAGEQMADEMGDAEFAARCRKIFDSGMKLSCERLWNGEYFIQQVDLQKYPGSQYADGCLADQMFGQNWAHLLNLGYIYPAERVRSSLESVWKYNWAPDTGPQNAMHVPERWFVRNSGEPGLFICTWPKSRHMEGASVRYRDEVWTGIEYQVAGGMIWEGMTDEPLSIIRAVHERYTPAHRRNPYDEVECGDHYARAMASWGVYAALCGYDYHGPKGHIGFAPKLTPENFRAAFTAAEGWGTFSQTRKDGGQTDRIEVKWGKLRVNTLSFAVAGEAADVKVTAAGEAVPCTHAVKDGRLEITLQNSVTLLAGESLEVGIR